MLLRHAMRYDRTVALPRYDLGHIGWPSPFRASQIWGYPVINQPDILAHHSVYDRCHVMKVFPKQTTMYVTIIREPFSQFKSSMTYFGNMIPVLQDRGENRYITFLENAAKLERQQVFRYLGKDYGKMSLTRNLMSADLGYPYDKAYNQTARRVFLKRIEEDFDLVMLMEYFHESLILLKRLMCWDMRAVVHLAINQQHSTQRGDQTVDARMRKLHQKFSAVDHALYEQFNKTFWRKVSDAGPTFRPEVLTLTRIIHQVTAFCSRRGSVESFTVVNSTFNAEFNITSTDCRLMKLSPDQLTPRLWAKMAEYAASFAMG